jgi:hypothetical protein
MTSVAHMLCKCVECFILWIESHLDVVWNWHPFTLRAEITATFTTMTAITETSWASRPITAISTRRTSRAVTALSGAAATTEAAFSTAAPPTISSKSIATSFATISTLLTVFAISVAFDDLIFFAEIRHPCWHHAQAGQIERIGLGCFGSAGFGFAHKIRTGAGKARDDEQDTALVSYFVRVAKRL